MGDSAGVVIIGSYAKAIVVTAERIPLAGETLVGWDYRQTFGGKGSDMAVQAARLGSPTKFIGVVGQDQLGDEFVQLMTDEGVDITALRRTAEQPTGVGLIIKDVQARNVIVVDKGANDLFSPKDIDQNLEQLSPGAVALGQLEIPLETVLHALATAKERGLTTILNPAPAVDLTQVDLSMVDIITPNETEARVVLGLSPDDPRPHEDLATALLDRGCSAVVMTLGEQGSLVVDEHGTTQVPPIEVEVVDSNGAGDSFNAGLAVALSEGQDLRSAARFASVTSGLCCTDWETVPSYKYRNDIEAALG